MIYFTVSSSEYIQALCFAERSHRFVFVYVSDFFFPQVLPPSDYLSGVVQNDSFLRRREKWGANFKTIHIHTHTHTKLSIEQCTAGSCNSWPELCREGKIRIKHYLFNVPLNAQPCLFGAKSHCAEWLLFKFPGMARFGSHFHSHIPILPISSLLTNQSITGN